REGRVGWGEGGVAGGNGRGTGRCGGGVGDFACRYVAGIPPAVLERKPCVEGVLVGRELRAEMVDVPVGRAEGPLAPKVRVSPEPFGIPRRHFDEHAVAVDDVGEVESAAGCLRFLPPPGALPYRRAGQQLPAHRKRQRMRGRLLPIGPAEQSDELEVFSIELAETLEHGVQVGTLEGRSECPERALRNRALP